MFIKKSEYANHESFAQDILANKNLTLTLSEYITKTLKSKFSDEDFLWLETAIPNFLRNLSEIKDDHYLSLSQALGFQMSDFENNLQFNNARGKFLNYLLSLAFEAFTKKKNIELNQDAVFKLLEKIKIDDESFIKRAAQLGEDTILSHIEKNGQIPFGYWPNDIEMNLVMAKLRENNPNPNIVISNLLNLFHEIGKPANLDKDLRDLLIEHSAKLTSTHKNIHILAPVNNGANHYVLLEITLGQNKNITLKMTDTLTDSENTNQSFNYMYHTAKAAGFAEVKIKKFLEFTKRQTDDFRCAYYTVQAIAQKIGLTQRLGAPSVSVIPLEFAKTVLIKLDKQDLADQLQIKRYEVIEAPQLKRKLNSIPINPKKRKTSKSESSNIITDSKESFFAVKNATFESLEAAHILFSIKKSI